MKFRNKILTNIVITTGASLGFAVIGGYVLNQFIVLTYGYSRFPLEIILFAISWPTIFIYRSMTLPKSITFLEEKIIVERTLLGSKEHPLEDITAISSKGISNNEESYLFILKNGTKLKLALETYEVRKLQKVIEDRGLPQK